MGLEIQQDVAGSSPLGTRRLPLANLVHPYHSPFAKQADHL